jgi:hydroxymethylbilane synthase
MNPSRGTVRLLLRVGARDSKLSNLQTDLVTERLRREHRDLEIEKVVMSGSGEKKGQTPRFTMDHREAFEKEVERAILEGRVDFAVRSLKEVPIFEYGSKLVIAGILERGSPADVLVSRGDRALRDLDDGSTVGTRSFLRTAQLKRIRSDLVTKPIWGNLEVRLHKVDDGEYDAVILSEAGLTRLGASGKISERLPLEDFLPAPCQGTIATLARHDNDKAITMLRGIENSTTRAEVEAERELVRVLQGACRVPVGALASSNGDTIQLTAYAMAANGQRLETKRIGRTTERVEVARKAANDLLIQEVKRFEEGWRNLYR